MQQIHGGQNAGSLHTHRISSADLSSSLGLRAGSAPLSLYLKMCSFLKMDFC